MHIRTVFATRYVMALREGGSLPAIVEADDDGMYVVKFKGAAQGPKALIAELITGEIGRALGLPVPEIVLIELDPLLARSEPHGEIRELVQKSAGLNIALDFLPGSLPFDPLLASSITPPLASAIVWLDAYTSNVDRTPRNTNMLMWHKRLWLIDHGASLYFHHAWENYLERSQSPFSPIKQHTLLPFATALREADEKLSSTLSEERIHSILELIPESWLNIEPRFATTEEHRAAYLTYLTRRLQHPRAFVEEAIRAHQSLI